MPVPQADDLVDQAGLESIQSRELKVARQLEPRFALSFLGIRLERKDPEKLIGGCTTWLTPMISTAKYRITSISVIQ